MKIKLVKNFLLCLILVVISQQSKAQYLLPEYIENVDSTMPLIYVDQFNGGYQQVDSQADRDAIPYMKRAIGMMVTYNDTTMRYEGADTSTVNWLLDVNWTEFDAAMISGDTIFIGLDTIIADLHNYLHNTTDILTGDLTVTDTLVVGTVTIPTSIFEVVNLVKFDTILYNTNLGHLAGYSNTIGTNNVYIGDSSAFYSTKGVDGVFIGSGSGRSTTDGVSNIFIGSKSGYSNTTGQRNTFLGKQSGYSNSTGSYNTFLGRQSGYSNVTGQLNVFIGNEAGSNETGSNKLYMAVSNITTPLIYGEFDNEFIEINGHFSATDSLRINGSAYVDTISDFGDVTISVINVDTLKAEFIEITGGQKVNITTVNTATYDLLVTDYILDVTYTSTGAVTSLTLPTAQVVRGRIIIIKDSGGTAGTNNITIDTEGAETIDGAATAVISSNYTSINLYSDGTNWFIY